MYVFRCRDQSVVVRAVLYAQLTMNLETEIFDGVKNSEGGRGIVHGSITRLHRRRMTVCSGVNRVLCRKRVTT